MNSMTTRPCGNGIVSSLAPLLVFSDDWGRHPSSCQHLIARLLPRHPVYWVNTIGMRTPHFDVATVRRGIEKMQHWLRPRPAAQALPDQLHVLNPRMWPWFSSRFGRLLNRKLLARQLRPALAALAEPAIAVTTLPIVADLMDDLPVRRWVYYCVDDFGEWPGLDQRTLRRLEQRVIERADVLIAVSETLQDKLTRAGRQAHLLTHGVDPEFWSREGRPSPESALAQLDGLERPLVVFWGATDRRMDVAFLRRLAADLKGGTIVLVGPYADPDPALFESKRVVHIPPLEFGSLPGLAQEAAVLIMPYADLPVTRAIQPLKLKEYLATGRPTVVRDLPATRPWADCLDLADSPEAFSQAVRRCLVEGLTEAQKRARARLADETWDAKARDFQQWILDAETNANVACRS
jgi:glycosyltransferase involved in cell wall biosynthesis